MTPSLAAFSLVRRAGFTWKKKSPLLLQVSFIFRKWPTAGRSSNWRLMQNDPRLGISDEDYVHRGTVRRYSGGVSSGSLPKKKSNDDGNLFAKTREGIRVAPFLLVDFGNLKLCEGSVSQTIWIKNESRRTTTLQRIFFPKTQDVCTFQMETESGKMIDNDRFQPILVEPGEICNFQMHCTPRQVGTTKELCVFDFSEFRIGRWLRADIRKDLRINNENKISRKKASVTMPMLYGYNNIPKYISKVCYNGGEALLKEKCPSLFESTNEENYKERFETCLWFEEISTAIAYREFDIKSVVLKLAEEGVSWILEVPRLHEAMLKPLVGGRIKAEAPSAWLPDVEGKITKICLSNNDLILKLYITFPKKFHALYSEDPVPLNIQFLVAKNVFRRLHFAVKQAREYTGYNRLFPQKFVLKEPQIHFYEDSNVRNSQRSSGLELRWYNSNLNEEQKNAVRRILRDQGRPLPYILFGPPGTGKTITLIEAILQIYFLEPNSRILVTVPSNAGADLVAEKLVDSNALNPGGFVRFTGFVYSENSAQETIAKFCSDDITSVTSQRLVVATVSTAGQFLKLPSGIPYFTHVFVDEAGYCTEPETLIPFLFASIGKESQIVVAGDPQQLGPVLTCNIQTPKRILECSLLERLMNTCQVYARDEINFPETMYNPTVLTKLLKSYRCHPVLLKVPSQLFYSGDLVSHANKTDSYDICERLEFIPRKGIPLIFHGVKGSCKQEEDSPSWYNMEEIDQVVDYISHLIRENVYADDIGVITPYRKQVEKLKIVLESRFGSENLPKIASVQEFQGGERKVIIISTVRSSRNVNLPTSQYDFIYSSQRFNVAITRAKGLMIVIGDSNVLCGSSNWGRLLEYAVELGVYVGIPLAQE